MRYISAVLSFALVLLMTSLLTFVLPCETAAAASWGEAAGAGIGGDYKLADTFCNSSAVFDGAVYVGTANAPDGCEVWSYDGMDWERAGVGGFGDAHNREASSMAVHDGRLYVGTWQEPLAGGTGCEIWSTAGKGGTPYGDWRQENEDGFGDVENREAGAMVEYFSSLFVGGVNYYRGCSVWNTGSVWYLAEGATLGGFETWVLVQNPGAEPVHVDFTLNTGEGEVKPPELRGVEIPPGSRRSFDLGKYVQTYDVSTRVAARDGLVICERAMYWTPPGTWGRILGHDSIGVTYSSPAWYLAEGATYGGFETWVLVQNPGADPVHVDFTLNTGEGEVKPPELQGVEIGAGKRASFDLGLYAQTYDVSTYVECLDGLVVCERAMYLTPPGGPPWSLGHDSVGVNFPTSVCYLPEGATYGGFSTWVLVQNPGEDPVHVDFTLNTDRGEVKPPELQGVEIGAGKRASFDLGLYVQTYDVSTKVVCSDGAVVCERAMYWKPSPGAVWTLGHDSIGYTP